MKVEVADRKNMYSMCVATIVDVIGDRLRLRYDGLEPDVAEDFWCHYQSSEIHPIGWSSLVGHTLQPPIGKNELTTVHPEVGFQRVHPYLYQYSIHQLGYKATELKRLHHIYTRLCAHVKSAEREAERV